MIVYHPLISHSKLACRNLTVIFLIVVLSFITKTLQENVQNLPDFFTLLADKEKFRIQYELNGLRDGKYDSILVDEAYSFKLASGRLMIDSNGYRASNNSNKYNIFYWNINKQNQESFWLKPFICCSSYTKLNEKPMRAGIFEHLLPNQVHRLMIMTGGLTLHGISALIGNVVEEYSDNLKLKYPVDQKLIEDTYELEHEELVMTDWKLNIDQDTMIEFSFFKDTSQQSNNKLINLRISFNKIQDYRQICVAQVILLKIDFDFSDQILELPQGYSCQRNLIDDTEPDINVGLPLRTESGLRPKFALEITVSKTNDKIKSSEPSRNYKHLFIPEPLDSIQKAKVESRVITWLNDKPNKSLIFISHLIQNTSMADITVSPSLIVYDFNTMRKRIVHGQTGPCDPQTAFNSSLFKNQLDFGRASKSCPEEGVELELSRDLILRLNSAGLKMLQFTLQDRENLMLFIDRRKVNMFTNEEELVYEMPANDQFCFYHSNGTFIKPYPIRLVTRYNYNPSVENKNQQWVPKSTSIMLFDDLISKLIFQVDINLLHFEDYNPWNNAKHLLDLSSCFLGPKQSAKLTLDYPLTKENKHLKNFEQPHKEIRQAIANYFQVAFLINWNRIPSIDVSIFDDMVQVEVDLLDESHLLDDSQLMPLSKASTENIMSWLSRASRSILLSSVESCADYCKEYQCQVYTYCKFSASCYIFRNHASLNLNSENQFGSFKSKELDCSSYQVSNNRIELSNSWRKNSWTLVETLESITNSVDRFDSKRQTDSYNIPTYSSDDKSDNYSQEDGKAEEALVNRHLLSGISPNLELTAMVKEFNYNMLTRLEASYAHYKYNNVHGNSLNNDRRAFRSLSAKNSRLGSASWPQSEKLHASNFRVALSGYQYLDDSSTIKTDLNSVQQFDLDDSKGFLVLAEHELEDCAKACLNDLKCSSFSYCTASNTTDNLANKSSSECIISVIDNKGFSLILESILNNVPIQESQQSLGDQSQLVDGLNVVNNSYCSIMIRTYSDQFEELETKMLFDTKNIPISDVLSVSGEINEENCAYSCIQQRFKTLTGQNDNSTEACLSYDYCHHLDKNDKSPAACIFYKKHLVSSSSHRKLVKGDHDDSKPSEEPESEDKSLFGLLRGKLQLSEQSFCRHYIRNFLTDFHKLPHKRLPLAMTSFKTANHQLKLDLDSKTEVLEAEESEKSSSQVDENEDSRGEEISDISLDKCARLCEEDPNCGAFQYCRASYKLAPDGLYLSCSLGTNETLMLSPVSGSIKLMTSQEAKMKKLLQSKVCSVYIYKSLSMMLGHKKKNLAELGGELVSQKEQSLLKEKLKIFRLEAIVFIFFLVFGFLVYDTDLRSRLGQLGQSTGPIGKFVNRTKEQISVRREEPSLIITNEFNLQRIGSREG